MVKYKMAAAQLEVGLRADPARAKLGFTSAEYARLVAIYLAIGLLHVCGCGLYLYYTARYPALVGLGLTAYLLGLRHAFDADHIAAVDDTVRYMLQQGKCPLGIGFFFSLGHSTIVLLLSVALMSSTAAVKHRLPWLQSFGPLIGTGVSGIFLWLIGALNLLVLLDTLKIWSRARTATHDHAHLDELLARRGFINRLLGKRLRRFIRHSWQMYPLGLLFGLGFDTASEVGMLVMTAGASAGNLPAAAVLSLPILFASGMSVIDTTDGVLMSKAYTWAFVNPLRKVFYNFTITGLSVAVALIVGTIEILQVWIGTQHLHGRFFNWTARLNFSVLGYAVVALFVLAWGVSLAVWKWGRFEKRHDRPGPDSR